MIETLLGALIIGLAFAIYAGSTRDRARIEARRKVEDRLAMMREADDTRDAYRALRALERDAT